MGRWTGRVVALCAGAVAVVVGSFAARAAPPSADPGTVIYEHKETLTVGKDGAGFSFKASVGDSYNIEFQQSVMPKACTWKVGATEFATTKSGKMWLKIRVPFEADAEDMKVSFSIEGFDGTPCKPYKIKGARIVKA